jgi:TnsA endonuclease N terminal/TnsA endonuclease C terminal
MVVGNKKTKRQIINQRIDAGCGQGRGIDYVPAIWIRDFSSKGLSTQSLGWKTRRVHHFFSSLEFGYFLTLEWSAIVTDIREQYPLSSEDTLLTAQECGIKHPQIPNTREPNVMTTDFLVTLCSNIGVVDVARTVKPIEKLSSKRVLEKLEIERRYWEKRNISWGIVTQREIDYVLVENLKWLHNFFYSQDLLPLTENDIKEIGVALTKEVTSLQVPLKDIAAGCDSQFGLEKGSSLCVARNLIANRQWLININQPIKPEQPLIIHPDSPLLKNLKSN